MAPIRALTRRLRADESGFGLIEVIVSSMLLVLVASGVYVGLDAASTTSGINKHRSIATAIAQQDQDRMRAMAVTELSNYRDTSTTTVGTVTYTVRSTASWVTDDTGVAGCANENDPGYAPADGSVRGSAAHYLRIASEVTWPGMRVPPVTIESVVAPPVGSFGTNLGSLAVHVRDRNGEGVPGVSVSLTGPQSHVALTNQQGCVLWGYLPVGNYQVALAKQGYVDRNAVSNPSKATSVVGEATATVAFDYDRGGEIQAHYETLRDGATVPATAERFSIVGPHLTVPLVVDDGPPSTVHESKLVFPDISPYGVYAGACAGANPTSYGLDAQLALVTPGANVPVTVRVPPVNLRVLRDSRPVEGAVVRLTATASGCGGTTTRTTGPDGFLTERGMPYGTYDVCAQAVIGGVSYAARASVANTAPTGVPADRATLALTTTGRCA